MFKGALIKLKSHELVTFLDEMLSDIFNHRQRSFGLFNQCTKKNNADIIVTANPVITT